MKTKSRPRAPDYVPASADAVLDKADVARWFKVHPRTVQRLIHTQGLPTLNLMGRSPRFRAGDVLAWLAERGKKAA